VTEVLIGLIPAAGKGGRLGLPYPKELYPIITDNQYKPVSQYVLENLTSAGICHAVFVINETKHQLVGYFGNGSRFGCHISYVVQEQTDENNGSASPGLAHALNSANHLTRDRVACFGMADTTIQPQDVFRYILCSMLLSDDVALGLFPITCPEKSAAAEFAPNYRLMRIIDKPKQTQLPYGWACIVCWPIFMEHLDTCVRLRHITDFATVMNSAIECGMRFRAVVIPGGSYSDLGTYEDIIALGKRHRAL
jgi:glucose-1-phosphate thymidylyltransferase